MVTGCVEAKGVVVVEDRGVEAVIVVEGALFNSMLPQIFPSVPLPRTVTDVVHRSLLLTSSYGPFLSVFNVFVSATK